VKPPILTVRWGGGWRSGNIAGRMSVSVEIDGAVVDMLIASNWLLDGESADRKKIGIALSAMIAEAAKP
jgi:hypothetical protein